MPDLTSPPATDAPAPRGPSALSIVAEYFPALSPAEQNAILWGHTGFPHFWLDSDGATPEQCLRTQLARLRDDPTQFDRDNAELDAAMELFNAREAQQTTPSRQAPGAPAAGPPGLAGQTPT